jgi:hypothetical protein
MTPLNRYSATTTDYNDEDTTMRALRQSVVLTPALDVAVDPSAQQPTTN